MDQDCTTDAARDDALVDAVRSRLLEWWDAGHRDLPWRRTRDPYAILVSEVMLQQTQVSRVTPKYVGFMARFPSPRDLAATSVADVIREWSGLGYNRRAVNLHRLARVVVEQFGGELPKTVAGLRALPGVGDYTARAVASIAFGESAAAVDTNVRRVLTRVVDGPDSNQTARAVQRLADRFLDAARPGDWNQALMELGARACLSTPLCPACPLREDCATAPLASVIRERRAAYRASPERAPQRFAHSSRFYRGRIVEMLRVAGAPLSVEEVGARLRLDYSIEDRPWLDTLLDGLARDQLITREGGGVCLPGG